MNSFQIEPPEELVFHLSLDDIQQQCTLKLSNQSSNVAQSFKVKTTKPKRYLVRPNQGLIFPGESEIVTIVILAPEKAVILEGFDRTGTWDESNKFLVQWTAVDDSFVEAFKKVGTKDQSVLLNDLWSDSGKYAKDTKQKKLKVRFWGESQGGFTASTVNLDNAGIGRFTGASVASDDRQTMEGNQLWNEIKLLRKKYEDLVAFTVNLTAEKDSIQHSLEAVRDDLQKESTNRRQLETQLANNAGRQMAGAGGAGRGANKGIGLLYILFFAILAYLVGVYYGRKYN